MRRKPYTATGIARLACFRCGNRAQCQWSICADGNQFRPLCIRCDIALNAAVLRFMRDPEQAEKMRAYRAKMRKA